MLMSCLCGSVTKNLCYVIVVSCFLTAQLHVIEVTIGVYWWKAFTVFTRFHVEEVWLVDVQVRVACVPLAAAAAGGGGQLPLRPTYGREGGEGVSAVRCSFGQITVA